MTRSMMLLMVIYIIGVICVCAILAEMLIGLTPGKGLRIQYDIPENNSNVYCDYVRVGLDTSKLERLGWRPSVPLCMGIERVVKCCNNDPE